MTAISGKEEESNLIGFDYIMWFKFVSGISTQEQNKHFSEKKNTFSFSLFNSRIVE
jgi:hypothetical protein